MNDPKNWFYLVTKTVRLIYRVVSLPSDQYSVRCLQYLPGGQSIGSYINSYIVMHTY